jgi:ABC-type enterochelin transport system ATPase subunit
MQMDENKEFIRKLTIDDLIGHAPLPWEEGYSAENDRKLVEEFLEREKLRKRSDLIMPKP